MSKNLILQVFLMLVIISGSGYLVYSFVVLQGYTPLLDTTETDIEMDNTTELPQREGPVRDWYALFDGRIVPASIYSFSTLMLGGSPLEYDSQYNINWQYDNISGSEIEILLSQRGSLLGILNRAPLPINGNLQWDVKTYYAFEDGKPRYINPGEEYAYTLLSFTPDGELLRIGSRDFITVDLEEKSPANAASLPENFVLVRNFPYHSLAEDKKSGFSSGVSRHSFTAYDPRVGEEYKIFERVGGYTPTRRNKADNNSIYFINTANKLEQYDIAAESFRTFLIPGALEDYLVVDDGIYFIESCLLEYYDERCKLKLGIHYPSTDTNSIIIQSILDSASPVMYGGFNLVNHDKLSNTLQISTVGGDGGMAWGKLYEFDLTKQTATLINEATSVYCGEDNMEYCNEEDLRENEKFAELFGGEDTVCGGFSEEVIPPYTRTIGCIGESR